MLNRNLFLRHDARLNFAAEALLVGSILASGCGESARPTGSLSVFIQAEDTITEGLEAGTGPEQIVDGWSVTFDKYLVAIGHLHMRRMGGGGSFEEHDEIVTDLRRIPESGRPFAMGANLPEGRYSFEYRTPIAEMSMERDAAVSQADFDRMVAEGCTYLIVGSATNGMRTIRFDLCLAAETIYECSSMEGVEGIAIAAGANSAFMTIHGDHLFFNGFPEGAEGGVRRRAGWLALVDDATGRDGLVTKADLERTPVSILPASDYALSGAPQVDGMPIMNMATYARAQLMTQGHLNGEGECLANGMGHSHDELRRGL